MQEGDPDVSQSRDLRRRMRWIHTRHVFFVGNPVQKGDNHSIFWPNSIKRTPCMVFLAVFVFGSTLIDTHFCWINQMFITEGHFSTFSWHPVFFSHLDTWTTLRKAGVGFPKNTQLLKAGLQCLYGRKLGPRLKFWQDFDHRNDLIFCVSLNFCWL